MHARLFSLMAVAGLCTALTACSAQGSWSLGVSCDFSGRCGGQGEIKATWPHDGPPPGPAPQALTLAMQMLASAEVPDAYQFQLDVSGSTVSYPTTGSVTLSLTDANTNAVIAAESFPWTRTGNVIRLGDPNAANAWAASVSGNIGGMTYRMAPFTVGASPGMQTVAMKSVYEGQVTAAATSTFEKCTTYPSPYMCMQ